MEIRGRNISVNTKYNDSDLYVNMDVYEFDDIKEVIYTIGESEILEEMDIKSIMDYIDINDIHDYKKMKDVVNYDPGHILEVLLEEKGEEWIMDHISDSSIITEARERNINRIL